MARVQGWFGIAGLMVTLAGCVSAPAAAPGGLTPTTPPGASATPEPVVAVTPAPVATPVPAPTPSLLASTPQDLVAVWDTKYLRVKLTWVAGCQAAPCIYQLFRTEGTGAAPSAGEGPHAEIRGATEFYDNVQRGKFYSYWLRAKETSGQTNGFTASASVSVPAL